MKRLPVRLKSIGSGEGGTVGRRACHREWMLLAACWLAALLTANAAHAQNAAESTPPANAAEADAAPANTAEADPAEGNVEANAADASAADAKPKPAKSRVKPGRKKSQAKAEAGSAEAVDKELLAAATNSDRNPLRRADTGIIIAQASPGDTAVGPVRPPAFVPDPGATDNTSAAPQLPVLPPLTNPNSAETRGPGGSSTNFAEGYNALAEPPLPDINLPSPSDFAGSSRNYEAPSINLIVPDIDPLPALPPNDAFQRPGREYVETRPLPPVSETETAEERAARNIEEALKRIDLNKEQRPDAAVQLPLSSGQVFFKAADSFSYDRRKRVLTFTGNAELLFGTQLVAADFIEVDDGAATAYAKGYVMVQQADEVVYADEAYINYDTLQLELFNVEGNTGGQRLTNGVVYFRADRAYGTWNSLIMEHVEVTTCDPFCGQTEEYHLSARKVFYKRDRSIRLRDVHAYIRGHKVFWAPVIAMPLTKNKRLTNQESDVQQNYGFNSAEGWFAKFGYTYWSRYVERAQTTLLGKARVDIQQNLGVGVAIKQDYYLPQLGVTTMYGFYQEDWPTAVADNWFGRNRNIGNRNYEFMLNQELNLSRSLKGTFNTNRVNTFRPPLQQNDPATRIDTWTTQFNLGYTHGDTHATLTGNSNINTTGGTENSDGTTSPRVDNATGSANFNLTHNFSDELKYSLDQQYTTNKGGSAGSGIPADQEGNFNTFLEYRGKAETPMEGYIAKLSYREQGIDYDQDRNTRDNNVQINKEMPRLDITLPRDVFGYGEGAYFNDFTLSFGNLVSGRRRAPQSSFRVHAHAGGNDNWQFSRASSLTSSTDLDQFLYDDGNAQYAINQSTSYTYDPRKTWRLRATHNVLFRQGVREPPITQDRRTYQQRADLQMMFTNNRDWREELSTSYSWVQKDWSPITSVFSYDPSSTASFYYTTNYDVDEDGPEDPPGANEPDRSWGTSTITSSFRSPHIDEHGYYNWMLNASLDVDTDYWERWAIEQMRLTYFRRYERGWSGEITGGFRRGGRGDHAPEFSEEFLRSIVKTITVRKVNCCTTIEGGWQAAEHSYFLRFYINALPQYPGTLDVDRLPRDPAGAAESGYLYQPRFLFPTESLRQDILNDVFGIRSSYGLF